MGNAPSTISGKIDNLNSVALLQNDRKNVIILGETHMKSAKNDYTKLLAKFPEIGSWNMIAETSKQTSKPGVAFYTSGVHSKHFTDSKHYKSFVMADEMRHDPVMWKILDVMKAVIGMGDYQEYNKSIIKYCKRKSMPPDYFYYTVLSFPLQICRIILNLESEFHVCEGTKAIKQAADLITDMEDIKDDPYNFVAEILKLARSLNHIAKTRNVRVAEILNLYKNEFSNYAYCIKQCNVVTDDESHILHAPREFGELMLQLTGNGMRIHSDEYESFDGVFLDMFFDLPAVVAFHDISCYENNFIISCGNVHCLTLERLLGMFGMVTKFSNLTKSYDADFDAQKLYSTLRPLLLNSSMLPTAPARILGGGVNGVNGGRIPSSITVIMIVLILAALAVLIWYVYLYFSRPYETGPQIRHQILRYLGQN